MSFQAYLDNIHAKTGKTPEQLKALATTAGVYRADMKAGDLVGWLKKEFDLGYGHSMAVHDHQQGHFGGHRVYRTERRPGYRDYIARTNAFFPGGRRQTTQEGVTT